MTSDASGGGAVEYYAPDSVEAARDHLADARGRVRVVAGGQTLTLLLREGFVDADVLVDVGGVPALGGLSIDADAVTIGATTTYARLADHRVSDRVAMLGEACSVIADRQVRHLGTVGGALAHADPALDVVPPLLCLDAEVTVGGAAGRRTVPLSSFLVGPLETDLEPDELLEAVRFERPDPDRVGTAYEKHSTVEGGWATVGAAASVRVDDDAFADVRVGLGAVADTAVRSPAVEEALRGRSVTGGAVESASRAVTADIDPVDDLAGSAAYKRRLAPKLVERALARAADRSGGGP